MPNGMFSTSAASLAEGKAQVKVLSCQKINEQRDFRENFQLPFQFRLIGPVFLVPVRPVELATYTHSAPRPGELYIEPNFAHGLRLRRRRKVIKQPFKYSVAAAGKPFLNISLHPLTHEPSPSSSWVDCE